jgi:enolase
LSNAFEIIDLDATEILDCRGDPTVRVALTLASGIQAIADVPAGRSTGRHEAVEVRDDETRYGGLGVRRAVAHVREEIRSRLLGESAADQRRLDATLIALDGTENKSRLGANAILGVSLAAARATALAREVPLYRHLNLNAHLLPVPLVNLINGGEHASNDLEFQEFCIFPVGAASFSEAMEISHAVNQMLREIIVAAYGKIAANVGDEGGFAPPIVNVREAMDKLVEAVRGAGVEDRIVYGLDCAATHLYNANDGAYRLEGKRLDADELMAFYAGLIEDYPIVSIEDPFAEDDVDAFVRATKELGIQIVGDDFFCTNPARLQARIPLGAANALLWKVNQIGTLSEAMTAAEIAFRAGYGVMVSERSGETEDAIIADLVVGLNAGQIKTGAPVRGERTAKYNRLLEIERELGSEARYAGRDYRGGT